MEGYLEYRKKETQLMRPYVVGQDMFGISVSTKDRENGSPMVGDMIAVSRDDKKDRWLVSGKFCRDNYIVC